MLFSAIDGYLDILRAAPVPVFFTSTPQGPDYDRKFEEWLDANRVRNAEAQAASETFTTESFALSTLVARFCRWLRRRSNASRQIR